MKTNLILSLAAISIILGSMPSEAKPKSNEKKCAESYETKSERVWTQTIKLERLSKRT